MGGLHFVWFGLLVRVHLFMPSPIPVHKQNLPNILLICGCMSNSHRLHWCGRRIALFGLYSTIIRSSISLYIGIKNMV